MTILRFLGLTMAGRAIVGVVALALVGGLIVAPRLTSGAVATQTRTQAVARANLSQTISVSGSVNPSSQVRAGFRVSGRLSEILVKVGDAVAVGQPLARIDSTDLQTSVKQAEANLLSAQAKYDTTVAGASAEDLAIARNALETATLNFEQAKKNTQTDLSNAQAAFAKAKTAYEAAKANYLSLTTAVGSDADVYARAIGDLRTTTLGIRGDLQSVARPGDTTTAYNATLQAELALIAGESYATAVLGPALADYTRSADLIKAAIGLLDRAIAEGWETTSATSVYQRALVEHQTATSRFTSALDGAAAQVSSAQASLSTASGALGTSAARADAALDGIRVQLSALQLSVTTEQQLSTSIKSRTAQATAALSPIGDAMGGTYQNLLQAIQTADDKRASTLAAQEIVLQNAQFNFQKSTSGPKATDIVIALASLQLSQISVEKARNDLANATLVALIAGRIVSVPSQIGEAPANPFIVVAATATLTLHGTVGESDIAKLKNGQVATIAVDAVGSGTRMTGRVTGLDPVATIQQGVPVYGVDVTIDIPDVAVRPGMSGTATVIVASKQGVLTVPNSAIRTSGGVRTLQVMRDGKVEDALVTFGISNDTVTEILTGLSEGDLIVLPAPRTTTTTTTGQQRPGAGGLVPGGGVQIQQFR